LRSQNNIDEKACQSYIGNMSRKNRKGNKTIQRSKKEKRTSRKIQRAKRNRAVINVRKITREEEISKRTKIKDQYGFTRKTFTK
jgi:hypothetical protein